MGCQGGPGAPGAGRGAGPGVPQVRDCRGREGLAVHPQLQWRVFSMSAEEKNAKNKRLLVRTDLNGSVGVI